MIHQCKIDNIHTLFRPHRYQDNNHSISIQLINQSINQSINVGTISTTELFTTQKLNQLLSKVKSYILKVISYFTLLHF